MIVFGMKHSLCFSSMVSKAQPSESMPTKNSAWAGSSSAPRGRRSWVVRVRRARFPRGERVLYHRPRGAINRGRLSAIDREAGPCRGSARHERGAASPVHRPQARGLEGRFEQVRGDARPLYLRMVERPAQERLGARLDARPAGEPMSSRSVPRRTESMSVTEPAPPRRPWRSAAGSAGRGRRRARSGLPSSRRGPARGSRACPVPVRGSRPPRRISRRGPRWTCGRGRQPPRPRARASRPRRPSRSLRGSGRPRHPPGRPRLPGAPDAISMRTAVEEPVTTSWRAHATTCVELSAQRLTKNAYFPGASPETRSSRLRGLRRPSAARRSPARDGAGRRARSARSSSRRRRVPSTMPSTRTLLATSSRTGTCVPACHGDRGPRPRLSGAGVLVERVQEVVARKQTLEPDVAALVRDPLRGEPASLPRLDP